MTNENNHPSIHSRKTPKPVFALEIDVTWFILIGLSSAVRLYKISMPNFVVFDEVHYGKYISYMIEGRFFLDANPPLGKLIFALTGYITGFDGSFTFDEIGQEIPHSQLQDVLCIRLIPTLFSIMTVPIIYEIILDLNCTYFFAIFGALLISFENTMVVQGRFIFLDAFLIFFIATSICCYIKFLKQYDRPFSYNWWFYLICVSISITGIISVKYTGILTVLMIGGISFYEAWTIITDITVSAVDIFRHFVARFSCLVCLPLVFYLAQFYVLLHLMKKSGPHDALMSSSFQRTLQGGLESITKNQAQEYISVMLGHHSVLYGVKNPSQVISYGSQITLRNTYGKQCWLHSHSELYPVKYPDGRGSSAQQQITCYAFKDVNNWFIVKHPERDSLTVDFPPIVVKNGDIIHLVHGVTGRGLNSHDVGAPINPTLMEVSGYIDHNVSMDPQFGWKVEIVNPDNSNVWKAIGSQIRLIHVNTSASIRVSGDSLPEWGFHQYEVGCDRRKTIEEAIWNVEEHNQNVTKPEGMSDEQAKQILKEYTDKQLRSENSLEMSFLQKFSELQITMLKVNNEVKQEHAFASSSFHWPLMLKGVAYWIDKSSNKQIFCIGNPLIYWTGTTCMGLYFSLLFIYLIRRKRLIYDIKKDEWCTFTFSFCVLFGGFFLHWMIYIPYGRTLFLHHYMPSLLYKILIIPVFFNHLNDVLLKGRHRYQLLTKAIVVAIGICTISSFLYFSPFTYGTKDLTLTEISKMKWLSSWNFLSHSS